jgi:hypothetical protein
MAAIPTITADTYGSVLTLTFSNGSEVVVDAAALREDIQREAMLHGLKQKLMDAAAIARNTDTGRSASVAEKYEAVKEIADRIASPTGTWNKVRGGESAGSGALLTHAIMRLRKLPRATVEEFLGGLTKEQKAALRKNPRVVEAMLEIQRERAGDTSESDGLLDGLM